MKHSLSKIAPLSVKRAYRLLRYPNERKRFVREFAIRKQQDENLLFHYPADTSKLILFIVPGSDPATGVDNISGGTMSIVSICEETVALEDTLQARTIMCTANNESLLIQHKMFANNTPVYRFEQLSGYFHTVQEILIHLPEFMTGYFMDTLSVPDRNWLASCKKVQVNIMNQNIQLMPEKGGIDRLKDIASEVTITTAHQKYCTAAYRKDYNVPLHKLSVWISPEQYDLRAFAHKEELMVVSPDAHPMKEAILKRLQAVDGLRVQIIQNLTYEQYKELIARAKWSLTFGEGLDGYFIEPVFSGAVSFAIYNEQFFTPDFAELSTVYNSAEDLATSIIPDMARLNNSASFNNCQKQQYELCSYYYSKEQYRKNIAAFYNREYTYV